MWYPDIINRLETYSIHSTMCNGLEYYDLQNSNVSIPKGMKILPYFKKLQQKTKLEIKTIVFHTDTTILIKPHLCFTSDVVTKLNVYIFKGNCDQL